MNLSSSALLRALTLAFLVSALCLCALPAEEVDLKSLKSLDAEKPDNKAPYVGAFGGTATTQSYSVLIEGNPYVVSEDDGAAFAGFEIGQRWRHERLPFEAGLEFEAMFSSTELSGTIAPGTVLPPAGISMFETDMNAATFLVNGQVGFNLRRYRPYLGTFLSNFKGYAGGGVGGSQLWFRNQMFETFVPGTAPSSSIFSTDSFVFAHQVFGGLEYAMNEKTSVFFDYRLLRFSEFDEEVEDYETESWSAGLRIFYDQLDDR